VVAKLVVFSIPHVKGNHCCCWKAAESVRGRAVLVGFTVCHISSGVVPSSQPSDITIGFTTSSCFIEELVDFVGKLAGPLVVVDELAVLNSLELAVLDSSELAVFDSSELAVLIIVSELAALASCPRCCR